MSDSNSMESIWRDGDLTEVSIDYQRLLRSLPRRTKRVYARNRLAVLMELGGLFALVGAFIWIALVDADLAATIPLYSKIGAAILIVNAIVLQGAFLKVRRKVVAEGNLKNWLTSELDRIEKLIKVRSFLPWFVVLGAAGGLLVCLPLLESAIGKGLLVVLIAAVAIAIHVANVQALKHSLVPTRDDFKELLAQLASNDVASR